ncbi:22839_t:CDS:1, partial [Rhizophagus irregularis]
IRDILVYDVPVSLTPEEILQQLTLWEKTISLQMKQQKKYQT